MKSKLLRLALLAGVLLTGCSEFSGDYDLLSSRYATYSDASVKGAFTNGWLPQALPKSALNITEVHNVDSNELWVVFNYVDDDIGEMSGGCVDSKTAKFPGSSRVSKSVPWWPSELTEAGDATSREKLTIKRCPQSRHAKSVFSAYIAIDPANNKAWYWLDR